MSKNDYYRQDLGISFTNGARRGQTETPTQFYDPMRASARQAGIDNGIYRDEAGQKALARRVGFSSYLNMPKNDG